MAATIQRVGEWLPRGWGDMFRQLSLFVLADLAYEFARGLATSKPSLAFANGERVIDAQQGMGLLFEPSVQAFFLTEQWVIDFANQIYLNSQFTVASAFLIWLYLFRNDAYYFVRNMLFASMGLALVGYIGYPTAPPRMFPEYGFVDTINSFSSVNHDSAIAKLFINPFAAVPSMHCAVALMIGGTGFMVTRHRAVRAFWACWPLLVAWVTVVTGNHYWIDIGLGWAVAVTAFLIASQVIARIDPEAWGLRTVLVARRNGFARASRAGA
ncbi:MAG: phosphatase PAP2 family protein [Solirubrobacterales bacterium]